MDEFTSDKYSHIFTLWENFKKIKGGSQVSYSYYVIKSDLNLNDLIFVDKIFWIIPIVNLKIHLDHEGWEKHLSDKELLENFCRTIRPDEKTYWVKIAIAHNDIHPEIITDAHEIIRNVLNILSLYLSKKFGFIFLPFINPSISSEVKGQLERLPGSELNGV